jgi:uncharacterized protein YjhX (UPF0386 family)
MIPLSQAHERVLRALAEGLVVKSHRTPDGEKMFRLHALDGSVIEDIDAAVMGELQDWKLIDSNKKFPAASYLLTEKGREAARGIVGRDIAALGARITCGMTSLDALCAHQQQRLPLGIRHDFWPPKSMSHNLKLNVFH